MSSLQPELQPEIRERLLNEFALRSFRDVADGDYIAARMAYRAELLMQAYWSSQQALEKYLKAILLFRRIPQLKPTHSLKTLLANLEPSFPLKLSTKVRDFISFVDDWDVDRYFIFPYCGNGFELFTLDQTVWEVRRYCLPRDTRLSPQGTPVEQLDLRYIEDAANHPPQHFRTIVPGLVERKLEEKDAAHSALNWKNLYFGTRKRKSITHRLSSTSHNSTLALYPEIIDELKQLIYVPHAAESLKRP